MKPKYEVIMKQETRRFFYQIQIDIYAPNKMKMSERKLLLNNIKDFMRGMRREKIVYDAITLDLPLAVRKNIKVKITR